MLMCRHLGVIEEKVSIDLVFLGEREETSWKAQVGIELNGKIKSTVCRLETVP